MAIYELEGVRPKIGATSFVHPDATVIGDVTIGENCFIAPGAVLRGDEGPVVVGDGSDVQDGCLLHAKSHVKAVLGKDNHLTHHSIVHGATLGDGVMLGMGAIIMDGAEIGDGSIVGAGAVILPGIKVPPGKTVIGIPGRVVGDASERAKADYREGVRIYQGLLRRYSTGMKRIG